MDKFELIDAMKVQLAQQWIDRIKAGGIHFGISLAVAAVAAVLVFVCWYPYPYREISGGRELFLIVVTVDVILGPLITITVFNRTKPWAVLWRDLAVVGVIQTCALAYGLWTVFVARPVHLVFEGDRFSVVHAVELVPELAAKAPPTVVALPLLGPTLLSLRPYRDGNEKADVTLAALSGFPVASHTELWQPYAMAREQVLKAAKPVADLKLRFKPQVTAIDAIVASTGRQPESLSYLPMSGRKSFWTVLIDAQTAEVLAFMPLDSF